MATSTEKTVLLIVLLFIIAFFFLQVTPFLLGGLRLFHGQGFAFGFPFASRFSSFIPLSFLFFLWLFVVVWVFRDAERRGMSGILWALLVFVGNLVGLLIYLIVRSDNFQVKTLPDTTEDCPNCEKKVTHTFEFCPHCGNRMKAVCSSCEKPISNDWKVCPYCGNKIDDKKK